MAEGGIEEMLHDKLGIADKSSKENMENQRQKLVELMDSEFGLLDKLQKMKTLSKMEIAGVKSEKTIYEKNSKILDYVFKANKHDDLIAALTDTGQVHLVNLIKGNGEYRSEFHKDWPLTEKEVDILDDNQEQLIDIIDTCGLLTLLFSEHVINRRHFDLVNSKQTSYEKNEALLDIIRRGSLSGYSVLIKCLHKTNQSHIAEILETGGVLLPAHATLEAEDLDDVEKEIVHQMENIVQQRPNLSLDQANRILAALQLRIIATKQGKSIVLYIWCRKLAELIYLCEVIDNHSLRETAEKLFNLLLQNRQIKVLTLKISESVVSKAKRSFERHPLQQRASETVLTDEGKQSQEKQIMKGDSGNDSSEIEATEDIEFDDDDDDDKDHSKFGGQHGASKFDDVGVARGKLGMTLPEYTADDIVAAIIRNNTDYLKEHMIPEGVIDKMHAADLLTDDDTRYIKTRRSRADKNEEILNLIDTEEKWHELIHCLRLSSQLVAADILETGGVTLKTKVIFKTVQCPDEEKHLVEMINSLQKMSIPKKKKVPTATLR